MTSKREEAPVLVTSATMAEDRPELNGAMATLMRALREHRTLPERLVELVRLRIAFRNQCRPCMSMRYDSAIEDGLTEDMVCSLERPDEPSDLSEAERAAVRFGDSFASDHLSITPDDRRALTRHFTPAEVAELAMLCAAFTGFGRLAAVMDAGGSHAVGDRRDDGTPLTPWRIDAPDIIDADATFGRRRQAAG